MTIQVAMIASDGWVLASDRNAMFPPRATALTAKIKFSDEWACSFWGDECAQIVSNRLITESASGNLSLSPPDEERFRALADDTWRKEYESQSRMAEDHRLAADRRRGVILLTRGQNAIVDLSIGRQSVSRILRTRFVGGDRQNLATYFVERYYSQAATVASLKQLAAHAVLRARDFNHQFIDDVQIVVCENGRVAEVNYAEVEKLKTWSKDLDEVWGKTLLKTV
jgi:hypothetical protein